MEIFLLIVILILVGIVVHQGKQIRELECKTLDAFRIVCRKINVQMELLGYRAYLEPPNNEAKAF